MNSSLGTLQLIKLFWQRQHKLYLIAFPNFRKMNKFAASVERLKAKCFSFRWALPLWFLDLAGGSTPRPSLWRLTVVFGMAQTLVAPALFAIWPYYQGLCFWSSLKAALSNPRYSAALLHFRHYFERNNSKTQIQQFVPTDMQKSNTNAKNLSKIRQTLRVMSSAKM